jgi:hypothetical protein
MDDLFDHAASQSARNEGMDITAKRNSEWLADYLAFVRDVLPADWVGTGEDIRAIYTGHAPDHPNAYGAAICNAVRLGLLVKTGKYLAMKAKKSHSRSTPEYRKAPA